MLAFLAWLYNRALHVKKWFTTWIEPAIKVIRYVRGWISTAAQAAYDLAKAYIKLAIAAAKLAMGLIIAGVASALVTMIGAVIVSTLKLVLAAKTFAEDLVLAAVRKIILIIDGVVTTLMMLITGAIDFASRIVAALALAVWSVIAQLLIWVSFLRTLKDLFTLTNLAKLLTFFQICFAWLLMFVLNPLGVLAAYLKMFFRVMFEYTMAYALGTVEATLPPWPIIGGGGSVLPPPGGDPPPPVESGLVPPLRPMYVSGYVYSSTHRGIDLGLTRGQEVHAMHDGQIIQTGASGTGYGIWVILKGGDWWSRYAHLESIEQLGQVNVKAGAVIGSGNSTGNSTGDHLHLEIKYKGAFINPALVLPI